MDQEKKTDRKGENLWSNFFAKSQLRKSSLINQMKGVIISVTHSYGAEVAKWWQPCWLCQLHAGWGLYLHKDRLNWS